MQLLTQYELSCILTGSLHIHYQFIVCAFIKYGAVHRASNKKSGRFGSKFESLSIAGMLFKIFLVFIAQTVIKGLPSLFTAWLL